MVDRRTVGPADCEQTRALAQLDLALEHIVRRVRIAEQIAIEPREIAVDRFGLDDALDAIDCGRMTLRRVSRAVFTMESLDLVVAGIEHARQMGRGA